MSLSDNFDNGSMSATDILDSVERFEELSKKRANGFSVLSSWDPLSRNHALSEKLSGAPQAERTVAGAEYHYL